MFRSDSTANGNVVRRFSPDGGGPSAPATYSQPRRLTHFERAAKRTIDIVGALTFFALFGPLYVIVALCVAISMGRPVHFWQNRLGENGQRFRFYKFRSMVRNSEDVLDEFLSRNDMARTEWDTFQKLEKDPRITPVGTIIRKLSLDELPQFWNVLKGDMSLVGPRPCMERQRSLYGKGWEHYCAVRPGITGLWQVSGRNRLSYARRVELDVEYVSNWSLWLDVKILLKTVRAVVSGEGSR
ncbi:Sugar transferase involved in LPS biosynthesis (colanic, teichoic acid) [Variovorax sp. HW608]|uniref:sugar transferase n=1 Tax=Variovorax sp. HW608 TaxID=1034889 RepID=UPI00081F8E82|nr:sugar transferase [Variovorax sp. HW608]SCK60903.1 Sugar transferase involved in LPS biosynthesis (colanic, teichoic acid) [Variovorax sp. HW608]